MAKKIILGLSGGIDSAVAALRLREAGYDVVAVTLVMHDLPTCGGESSVDAACEVARKLKLEHHILDIKALFKEKVLAPCFTAFNSGLTPNPCVLCNPSVKFHALEKAAAEFGANFIATGHYARIRNGVLRRGTDPLKDQTYFLYALPRSLREKLVFPLGDSHKSEIRQTLPDHTRPESQDICFTDGTHSFAELLRLTFCAKSIKGNYIDKDGTILGTHNGIHNCTVGQRRGLGIALGKPAGVTYINPVTAEITLSTDPNDLLTTECSAAKPVWQDVIPAVGTRCTVQTRYRQIPVEAEVLEANLDRIRVRFSEPLRAVTPGQALVLYQSDILLGGGEIER